MKAKDLRRTVARLAAPRQESGIVGAFRGPAQSARTVRSYRFDEWRRLIGAVVDVRLDGEPWLTGMVDAATMDHSIAWITRDGPLGRILIDKESGHTIWIAPAQLQE
jgi:hypothetical protein